MRGKAKVMLSLVLSFALTFGIAVPSAQAAGKVKLSKKTLKLTVGETKTIKVKNTKKKAKWSVTKGKKNIVLKKKKKASVKIQGKNAGSAVVTAKIGKKKLKCNVTVKEKKDTGKKPAASNAPVTSDAPGVSNAPVVSNAPTTSEAPVQSEGPTADPNLVPSVSIDLSKVDEVEFTQNGVIDFTGLLPEKFDLKYYRSMKVSFTMDFEGDGSDCTLGKIGLVTDSVGTLNGTDDGASHTMNMLPSKTVDGKGEVTVSVSELTGKALGINIQPMDGNSNYAWPTSLNSVTITAIEFIPKMNAHYEDPNATTKPTATPIATLEPKTFKYDGLDEKWIADNIDPTKPVVAMSFDDGPGGYNGYVENGTKIQEALKAHGAHATFFYIGAHINHDAESKKEVENAIKNGFEIANHSWDSNGLNGATVDVIRTKIQDTDALLQEISESCGKKYKNFLFRAPNVGYSREMFAVIDKPFIDVSCWSNDYDPNVGKDDIVANVKKAKDGDIINMHSVHDKTAAAVPEILDYFKDQGIQVVSVSELFAIKGKELKTATKYFSAN